MIRSTLRFLSAALLPLLAGPPAAATQSRDLKAFFQRTCATCHGPDGSGRAANGARLFGRNLADPKWQAKQKDSDLVKIIFLGKGSMPGFRGQLTEDECKQMVSDIIRPLAAKK